MNGKLKMGIEYLKSSCYSSGETEVTIGMVNIPGEIQAIQFRWIFLSRVNYLWFTYY
jgi:hypothetical protein